MARLSLPFGSPPSANGKFGPRTITLSGKKVVHLHDGTDWPTGYNTALRAMGDGVVSFKTYTALRGYQIGVRHPDGSESGFNLCRGPSELNVGSPVKAGDIIAWSGPHPGWEKSGAAATGPHTHAWLKLPGVGFVDMTARLKFGFVSDDAKPLSTITPAVVPPAPKENDEMIAVQNVDTKYTVLLNKQYIKHLEGADEQALLVAVSSAQDELHKLGTYHFNLVLAAYGIPTQFQDPKNLRKWSAAGIWSREDDNARKLDALVAR